MEDKKNTSSTLSVTLQEKISNAHRVGNFSFSEYAVPFNNMFELLQKQTTKYADTTWCIFYSDETGRNEISYAVFFTKVLQTVQYLLQSGIQRNDRVAVMSFNHLDTLIQYFALWSIGATAVPVSTGEDDTRIEYILRNSAAKLIFVREQFLLRFNAQEKLFASNFSCALKRSYENIL